MEQVLHGRSWGLAAHQKLSIGVHWQAREWLGGSHAAQLLCHAMRWGCSAEVAEACSVICPPRHQTESLVLFGRPGCVPESALASMGLASAALSWADQPHARSCPLSCLPEMCLRVGVAVSDPAQRLLGTFPAPVSSCKAQAELSICKTGEGEREGRAVSAQA